jgi:hypothetical protein
MAHINMHAVAILSSLYALIRNIDEMRAAQYRQHVCTKSHSKTCNFATCLLLAFHEYKKKSCSLFARSFNMMLLTFDQVWGACFELLTKCGQRNIAHMARFPSHSENL